MKLITKQENAVYYLKDNVTKETIYDLNELNFILSFRNLLKKLTK